MDSFSRYGIDAFGTYVSVFFFVFIDFNFTFCNQKEELRKSTYTSNRHSMMQMVYNCAFFVARKPA